MKKYEIIINDIIEKISSDVFKEGEQIYTEKEIKDNYNVSSTTAVRVLKELENSGYIFRVQGKGSFVSKAMVNRKVYITELNRFKENNGDHAQESSKVIGVEILHDNEFCTKTGISPQPLLKITRVKYIGDVAWAHQTNYIPLKYLPDIDIADIDSFKELATMIRNRYRIDIHKEKSKKTIKVSVNIPESISYYIANKNEPCFEFDRYTYLKNGDIFEYVKIYINYKYYEIVIKD